MEFQSDQVFYTDYVLVAVGIIAISLFIIFLKLRRASTFLLASGSLIVLLAVFGSTYFEPSHTELVTMDTPEVAEIQNDIWYQTQGAVSDLKVTYFKRYGFGPFLGSLALPGVLICLVGMLWFTLDVWKGQVANKSFNTDASKADAG